MPKDSADVPSAASFSINGAECASLHVMCGHLRALLDIGTKGAEGVRLKILRQSGGFYDAQLAAAVATKMATVEAATELAMFKQGKRKILYPSFDPLLRYWW